MIFHVEGPELSGTKNRGARGEKLEVAVAESGVVVANTVGRKMSCHGDNLGNKSVDGGKINWTKERQIWEQQKGLSKYRA